LANPDFLGGILGLKLDPPAGEISPGYRDSLSSQNLHFHRGKVLLLQGKEGERGFVAFCEGEISQVIDEGAAEGVDGLSLIHI
jgi:hypothetical protein